MIVISSNSPDKSASPPNTKLRFKSSANSSVLATDAFKFAALSVIASPSVDATALPVTCNLPSIANSGAITCGFGRSALKFTETVASPAASSTSSANADCTEINCCPWASAPNVFNSSCSDSKPPSAFCIKLSVAVESKTFKPDGSGLSVSNCSDASILEDSPGRIASESTRTTYIEPCPS